MTWKATSCSGISNIQAAGSCGLTLQALCNRRVRDKPQSTESVGAALAVPRRVPLLDARHYRPTGAPRSGKPLPAAVPIAPVPVPALTLVHLDRSAHLFLGLLIWPSRLQRRKISSSIRRRTSFQSEVTACP